MKTRGEAIVQDAKGVLNKVTALGRQTFTRSDMSELIEPFVSRVEFFFKSVVFPTCNRRTTLNSLINNLTGLGLPNSHIDALHDLRELYNTSKHDPDQPLKWRTCVDVCGASIDALEAMTNMGVASIDAPFEKNASTAIYVGFWDHYLNGETEVGLFLPSDHWMGTTPVSTFHMPFRSWDTLKPLLNNHPHYLGGESALGSDLWQSFAKEGDFLDAGLWEGEARELIAILSEHNDEDLENSVIPTLARKNSLISVGLAVVSAGVDVARSNPSVPEEALRTAIADRARAEYSADTETAHGQRILDAVVSLLTGTSWSERASIGGPSFRLSSRDSGAAAGAPVILEDSTFIYLI